MKEVTELTQAGWPNAHLHKPDPAVGTSVDWKLEVEGSENR